MSAHTGRVETWFGNPDDPNDRAYFRVSRDGRDGVYADWIIKPVVTLTHIYGTNRTYVEHGGYEPARVTWTLRFDDVAAYHAMLARYMTTATLCVLSGFQSLKGTTLHDLGRDYELLDGTMLVDIDDTPHFVGGHVEARCTFMRAVDPVTRSAVLA